jgi:uncharacterized membrane protein
MNGASGNRQRWVVAALVVSLAINAFIIGGAAFDVVRLRMPFRDHGTPPQLRFELGWLKGRLPPEGMAKIEEAIAAARPETVAHIDKLRGLRQQLAELIGAPQPDRAAIDAKLAEIRAEVTEMQTGVQRVSTEALLALPLDTRQKLAEDRKRDK